MRTRASVPLVAALMLIANNNNLRGQGSRIRCHHKNRHTSHMYMGCVDRLLCSHSRPLGGLWCDRSEFPKRPFGRFITNHKSGVFKKFLIDFAQIPRLVPAQKWLGPLPAPCPSWLHQYGSEPGVPSEIEPWVLRFSVALRLTGPK